MSVARGIREGLTNDLEQLSSDVIGDNCVRWAVEPDPGCKPELLAVLVY